ncbi:hypothetical protein VIGAN_03049000 [Vigna angularis var. angularis]|uniref:Uncharacterized protein n=1 Tax=Vigna angularis var. angularis TaxID=157739 RepID=A0A0S3RJV2_PHAAN|nr:hypothetical protein VIGAN_03049000 [Vigna angularis var. angularis]
MTSKKKSTQERYIPSTPKQTDIKLQPETLHNEKGCFTRKKCNQPSCFIPSRVSIISRTSLRRFRSNSGSLVHSLSMTSFQSAKTFSVVGPIETSSAFSSNSEELKALKRYSNNTETISEEKEEYN